MFPIGPSPWPARRISSRPDSRCVSGAALGATGSFFGAEKVQITMGSGRFPGQPRYFDRPSQPSPFDRLSQALAEIIDARVWGIHFRTADVAGAAIVKKVVHWMERHYFQPTG